MVTVSFFAVRCGNEFRFDCLYACAWGRSIKVISFPSFEEVDTSSKKDLKASLDNLSSLGTFSA